MPTRREMGSLESEVLICLWTAGAPLSPGEVRSQMGDSLAYTTVLTVLTRLWRKQLVEREAKGKGFVYTPLMSEAELAATRMQAQLRRSRDQEGALAQFVSGLSRGEARTLRRLMRDGRGD